MTDQLRQRVDHAIGKALDDDPMHNLTDLQHRLTTTVLTALLATGPDREHRIPLDDLTSNDLDHLYDDLDRYTEIVGEMNEAVVLAAKKIADYENRITWHTTCGSCARILDSSIRETHRADRAENAIAHAWSLHRESCPLAQRKLGPAAFTCGMCEALNPAATQATEAATTIRVFAALHRSAEQDVSRVIALYERWCAAGPPPLGTLMSRWWDARLVELHDAIRPPAHDAGPTVAEDHTDPT